MYWHCLLCIQAFTFTLSIVFLHEVISASILLFNCLQKSMRFYPLIVRRYTPTVLPLFLSQPLNKKNKAFWTQFRPNSVDFKSQSWVWRKLNTVNTFLAVFNPQHEQFVSAQFGGFLDSIPDKEQLATINELTRRRSGRFTSCIASYDALSITFLIISGVMGTIITICAVRIMMVVSR
jgi:hypothetical protein